MGYFLRGVFGAALYRDITSGITWILTHPRHDPLDPHKLNDTIEVIYRALDDEIAKMLMLAGNNIQCLIIAGHGMGPIYHASWNLNEILDLLGYGQSPEERA